MKHFQCVIHKPECSIQTQVVILKVLMIKSSAVAEPRWRDKSCSRNHTHLLKSAVNALFSWHFHYVHLTTCIRLEEIIYYQYLHLFSPVQLHGFFHNFIPVILFTDEICGLLFVCFHLFGMVTGVLQLFLQILHISLFENQCLIFHDL